MGCMEDYCYNCHKKLPEDDTTWLCDECRIKEKEKENKDEKDS